ncbi:heavy metal translocating P-type ATPase [Eubacterium sp. AF15-50]|uniref:Cd(2+)-exporting ATPase n=1 Tax=Eubacterium segne TaxID=2763045 RepID=A0ABR7F0X1_9FIRM|nr:MULTISPECIES: heavy metal translocating P-type ATPase [Eubacterium]MBC5667229.1 heavy metal translocating P-type ATPase [Eubacterium segne]RHR73331.1 heavy metal translocating P-type ATPase [Eubacterium sp. AF16-48]RHR81008.1 heavy metal translocating P-type ATPase [Eubacterium sp. AF15-50]
MKFVIKHEIRGRLRVHFVYKNMTFRQADILQYYLMGRENIISSQVFNRTNDAVICYSGDRQAVLDMLKRFSYEKVDVPEQYLENSGRQLNEYYKEKLINKIFMRYACRVVLPMPVKIALTSYSAFKYVLIGIKTLAKGKLEVPVLDATAISVSMIRGDINTAGSIMFLLGVGELLEEWTHKKSVGDLARSMSLNINKVWLKKDGTEIMVPAKDIKKGDIVVARMGEVVPFDGEVADGEAMINQASMTGEAVPVRKIKGNYVYAGTVVEEGEIGVIVKETSGSGKFDKIVYMIEESEKLKSSMEGKAEHLADKLVPYSLGGTILTYLLTRNATKAISILMVDYSCALKLAMPISVLAAIRQSNDYKITVKGGKFMEKMSVADTIVFDKTGTLTKAEPTVVDVVAFEDRSKDDLLRIAACLEEHFPHSMANAVVNAAKSRNLTHDEFHSKVEYIVAHGIATTINGKRAIIGSYHFVMEDEKCVIPDGKEELFKNLPPEYSHLYLAIENKLSAVILIEDPLREESVETIRELKKNGISKVVMMTGDSDRTAKAIAAQVGVDEYYSEVLPEDKAKFIESETEKGRCVIMIGDGINDSPALSKADVGIAISNGAQLARDIADITIDGEDLSQIVTLIKISKGLMKKIHRNYRSIVGINTALIILGACGLIQPATSALLHNSSTLAIGLSSMKDIEI